VVLVVAGGDGVAIMVTPGGKFTVLLRRWKMPNGFGRGGFGRGGGGFGFRGSSPPWPFVGLGRGGLPRCGYFFSGAAGMPASPGYPPYNAMPYGGNPYAEGMPYGGVPMGVDPYAGGIPYGGQPMGTDPYAGGMSYAGYGGAPMGANPYAPQMTREQELDFLRSQAEAIRGQLEQIDARIKELEKE